MVPFIAHMKGYEMHKEQNLKKKLKVLNKREMGIGRTNNDFRFVMNAAEFGEEGAEAIEDALVEQRISHRLQKEYGVLDFDF